MCGNGEYEFIHQLEYGYIMEIQKWLIIILGIAVFVLALKLIIREDK